MPTLETSIVLGRIWGTVMTIIALAFLINHRRYPAIIAEFAQTGVLLLSGIVSLFIGVTTVVLHNLWVPDWRVLVTLLGWTATIKGVMRVLFPEQISQWVRSLGMKPLLPWLIPALVFFLIVGLYLIMVTGVVPSAV